MGMEGIVEHPMIYLLITIFALATGVCLLLSLKKMEKLWPTSHNINYHNNDEVNNSTQQHPNNASPPKRIENIGND